jgi:hypothetical protein
VGDVCDTQPTRRELIVNAGIAVGAAAVAAALLGTDAAGVVDAAAPVVSAVEVMPGLRIVPRDFWGSDLPPKAPPVREDPKFLLVHHTASPNNYSSARNVIRTTYLWHTSNDPSKGWPDVAYEFFIGRAGDVYEGRAGALAGPVRADATGGSQGWAQLVCLLGDYTHQMPTLAAQASLVKVLAWLADRYRIDTTPGAKVTITSRGSQRWPRGTRVTTPTLAPHRAMSYTGCPGDTLYANWFAPAKIPALQQRVEAQRAAWSNVMKPAVRLGRVSP